MAEANPQVYKPDVARTLSYLAILYRDTQRFSESEDMHKEVLEICRRLAEANLQKYEPSLVWALNYLALMYSDTHRFVESEAMFKEALEIIKANYATDPEQYKLEYARNLGNQSNCYIYMKQFVQAE